ncbi:MAG: hypothetical protein IJ703_05965 [Eubacterium sp.]|nr:hypothetical protein [Eubacterium sp.]
MKVLFEEQMKESIEELNQMLDDTKRLSDEIKEWIKFTMKDNHFSDEDIDCQMKKLITQNDIETINIMELEKLLCEIKK